MQFTELQVACFCLYEMKRMQFSDSYKKEAWLLVRMPKVRRNQKMRRFHMQHAVAPRLASKQSVTFHDQRNTLF